MMNMAYQIALQNHIANQLENLYEYDERPRFQLKYDDLFQLSERQFIKLFRLRKDTTNRLINIVEEHSAVPSQSSALNATVQVSLNETCRIKIDCNKKM